jgi:hypothetical protein
MLLRFLVWLGLTRRYVDTKGVERWFVPIHFAPWHVWSNWKTFRAYLRLHSAFYVFRNDPRFIKWRPGRLLPRRWGFGFYMLIEFGDRG